MEPLQIEEQKGNLQLSVKTALSFLSHFIDFIENKNQPQKSKISSKRKDGLSKEQAVLIFEQTNAFFTHKWPHVIALLMSEQQKIHNQTQTVYAKIKELLALRGVKQH